MEALRTNCTPGEAWPGILTQTGHWPNYKCLCGHSASDLSPRLEMDIGNWARYSKVQHLKLRKIEKRRGIQNQQIDLMGGVGRMSALPLCPATYLRVLWSCRQTNVEVAGKVCSFRCKYLCFPSCLVLGVVVAVNLGPLCLILLSQSRAVAINITYLKFSEKLCGDNFSFL